LSICHRSRLPVPLGKRDLLWPMPRFVLLYHECPPDYERPSHWDLMIEVGDGLRTWAITRLPRAWSALQASTCESNPGCPPPANNDSVAAEQLADHRLAYLEKEGALSGERGRVSRIERGTFAIDEESRGRWQIALEGEKWRGECTLLQTGADEREWTLAVRQRGD
jgi:DNA polymerase Ligase (LigD)